MKTYVFLRGILFVRNEKSITKAEVFRLIVIDNTRQTNGTTYYIIVIIDGRLLLAQVIYMPIHKYFSNVIIDLKVGVA